MYLKNQKINHRSKNIEHLICFSYEIKIETAGKMIHCIICSSRTHISVKNIFNDIYLKYQICMIIYFLENHTNMCVGE